MISRFYASRRLPLTFKRTVGEAFKTPEWSSGFEPHIPPSFWQRVRLFFRRRFA